MSNNSKTYYFYNDGSIAYESDEEPLCVMTMDTPCSGCQECVY